MRYARLMLVLGMVGVLSLRAGDAVPKFMTFDGLKRIYRLYVPESATQREGLVPLVLVLHGGYGNGQTAEKFTGGGFDRLAARDGWIVAYPDGIERHWNDGRTNVRYAAHKRDVDDVGFLLALVDELAKTERVDPKKVFVTGVSNGAMMCQRLAFERPERFAGMAPVIGSIPEALQTTQLPPQPMPMLIINGTADPLMPWSGGVLTSYGHNIGTVVSVPKTVDIWREANRCAGEPTVEALPDTDPEDGCTATRTTYKPEDGGAPLILVTIDGGGHAWPGGNQYLGARLIGKVCRDFDGADLIWPFFRQLAGETPPPAEKPAAQPAAEQPAEAPDDAKPAPDEGAAPQP